MYKANSEKGVNSPSIFLNKTMQNKILIVEDDTILANTLKDYFEDNGLKVYHADNGNTALNLYNKKQPRLVLLDIVLPGKDGFEVISEIRKINLDIPVILMTGSELDANSQIKGYQLGTLNYMTKPILPQALLALIKNLLTLSPEVKFYKLNKYCIRIQSQSLKINNNKIQMREKDAILLAFLLDRVNQIVPRKLILQQIWLDDNPEKNNMLDGTILRLRRFLHPYEDIQIKTIYGSGYLLEVL